MKTHTEISKAKKSQPAFGTGSPAQSQPEARFEISDNRPETIAQRKLQRIANHRIPQKQHPTFFDNQSEAPIQRYQFIEFDTGDQSLLDFYKENMGEDPSPGVAQYLTALEASGESIPIGTFYERCAEIDRTQLESKKKADADAAAAAPAAAAAAAAAPSADDFAGEAFPHKSKHRPTPAAAGDIKKVCKITEGSDDPARYLSSNAGEVLALEATARSQGLTIPGGTVIHVFDSVIGADGGEATPYMRLDGDHGHPIRESGIKTSFFSYVITAIETAGGNAAELARIRAYLERHGMLPHFEKHFPK